MILTIINNYSVTIFIPEYTITFVILNMIIIILITIFYGVHVYIAQGCIDDSIQLKNGIIIPGTHDCRQSFHVELYYNYSIHY